jgi:hypothetical protein
MSAGPANDGTEDLRRLFNSMQVANESARRRDEIELTVQTWTDLADIGADIAHTRPATLSLKRDQTLFATLDAYIPCEAWGVLTTSDGKVWYIHNKRLRFDRQKAQNSLVRLEHCIRDLEPAWRPSILIQDLR